MINLNAFVGALKSTWIRRLLLNESKWQEIIKIHINLEMLTSCNVEYIQDILSTLNNQFWKDVLKSFLDINYKTEICEEQILKSPLFYNRNIKIDREMKKVNKQCLLDTPRTVRVSEKTWQVIVRTRRP